MRKRTAWIGALAIAGGVALGACSEDDPNVTVEDASEESSSSSTSSAPEDSASSAEQNDADVTFAQQMIVHHEQAIEMAQLATSRAESQEVLDLAARIEAAQQPEIDEMTAWLEAWGEEPMSSDMGAAHMGGMSMSEEQMTQLEAATGPAFDRMFLEMMMEHHQGAIEMAETEVAEGADSEALALAEKIIQDQTAEIEEMQALLEQL